VTSWEGRQARRALQIFETLVQVIGHRGQLMASQTPFTIPHAHSAREWRAGKTWGHCGSLLPQNSFPPRGHENRKSQVGKIPALLTAEAGVRTKDQDFARRRSNHSTTRGSRNPVSGFHLEQKDLGTWLRYLVPPGTTHPCRSSRSCWKLENYCNGRCELPCWGRAFMNGRAF